MFYIQTLDGGESDEGNRSVHLPTTNGASLVLPVVYFGDVPAPRRLAHAPP